MDYIVHEVDIEKYLVDPTLVREWPTLILKREERGPEAKEVTALPRKYWTRGGSFWVAKSPLVDPVEKIDWAVVRAGDAVAIPLFPYLTPPGADISYYMTHCLQAGDLARAAFNLHIHEPLLAMHTVKARFMYDLRPHKEQYRYSFGVAYSFGYQQTGIGEAA